MSNIFYECLGYNDQKIINKPLFFYHIPKCAGTTFSVILSHLFKTPYRINGPLFHNNSKGGKTGYKHFLDKKEFIINGKLDFVYGHIPFEVHKEFKKKYFFITILRDPVERCISQYLWMIARGYCSGNEHISKVFERNKLPKNAIVNQFSGKGFSEYNSQDSIDLAFLNLKESIDMVYDQKNFLEALNLIISIYNFPNVFFQKQQENMKKTELKKEIIEIIIENNSQDIKLYSKLKKEGIFKKFNKKPKYNRNYNLYLYSSPNILIKDKKTTILNNNEYVVIKNKLEDKGFIIK